MKIRILSNDNGVGLSRDIQIVKNVLSSDSHIVKFEPFKNNPLKTENVDVNVFLEVINPTWFQFAYYNVIIPNPDWFPPEYNKFLNCFNLALAKTHDGLKIFKNHIRTEFVGFESYDRLLSSVKKDYNSFLHVAGKSEFKSTEVIIKTWRENPKLPLLTLVDNKNRYFNIPPNIKYINNPINDRDLIFLQNSIGNHLCPSETEGFGHYIVEAMSCKSVVISTNGAPMNEMINNENGILCKTCGRISRYMTFRHLVNSDIILDAVNKCLNLTDEERTIKGDLARKEYERMKGVFRKNLTEIFKDVLTLRHKK